MHIYQGSFVRLRAGLTFTKVMLAVALLAVMLPFLTEASPQHGQEAREATAKNEVRMIAHGVRYYTGYGATTGVLLSLEDLTRPDQSGRSILIETPPDPWGGTYTIVAGETPRTFLVVCAGPDQEFDTDDDIAQKERWIAPRVRRLVLRVQTWRDCLSRGHRNERPRR